MIIESLCQFTKYLPLHPLFPKAYEFLSLVKQQGFPEGTFPLDDERLVATISSGDQEPANNLAAHHRSIELHYVVSGRDCIGWRPVSTCSIIVSDYAANQDKISYGDACLTNIDMHQDCLAVFFPYDAHALLPCEDFARRVIIKITS